MSVKTAPEVKAIAGSYEELTESVIQAIRAAGLVPEGGWCWAIGTFPGYVIVEVSASDMPNASYRVDYAEMSGQVVIGQMTEVEVEQVVVPVAGKALEMADLMATVDRATRAFKAGRVLSQRNLDELDVAIASLQRIRAAASGTDSTGSAPDKAQPAAKAADDLATPPRDLTGLALDIDILNIRAAQAAIVGG